MARVTGESGDDSTIFTVVDAIKNSSCSFVYAVASLILFCATNMAFNVDGRQQTIVPAFTQQTPDIVALAREHVNEAEYLYQ